MTHPHKRRRYRKRASQRVLSHLHALARQYGHTRASANYQRYVHPAQYALDYVYYRDIELLYLVHTYDAHFVHRWRVRK